MTRLKDGFFIELLHCSSMEFVCSCGDGGRPQICKENPSPALKQTLLPVTVVLW